MNRPGDRSQEPEIRMNPAPLRPSGARTYGVVPGNEDSMHVAFVITRGDAVGGATIHVRDMARYLLDRGHRATVLVGAAPAGTNDDAIAELRRYEIPCAPISSLRREIHPVHDIAAVTELTRALRRIQPDLVSTHTAKAGILGRIAARAASIPAIFTPHGWAISDRISTTSGRVFRLAERLAAPMAHTIVNVCEAERQLANTHLIAPSGKLAVIHNGVRDIPAGLRAEASIDPPRLMMVARFEAPKDHELLLRALVPLRQFDWTLDLVGSGPREAAMRALAAELGLGSCVRFTGNTTNTAEKLSQAQIFVLASKSEGFPRSILEAMRAGLPVVASDVGGVAEAVVHRETGFVVPRNDTASLTTALANLIMRPSLRQEFGQAGRYRYEQNFTFDQMAGKTLALYNQVLSRVPATIAVTAGSF
jgi:glycosyltransferase involved in cell wall biosynthesis